MIRLIGCLSIFLLLSSWTPESNGTLTPEQLAADVRILRNALEKHHPGIYWYTPKVRFDSLWDNLSVQIKEPLTADEFLRLVLPVVAVVQCAHTLFSPSKQIMESGARFPLDLKFIDRKAYILSEEGHSGEIPRGSELVSINRVPLPELLSRMLPALEAQGGNAGWKFVQLDSDFHNYYYYLIGHEEEFDIEYVDRSGQRIGITVKASANPMRRKHWAKWYPTSDGPPLAIRFVDGRSTAVISVKSFAKGRYHQFGQQYEQTLAKYFGQIRERGIKHLIIDVRGNEGGNQPEKLYAHIATGGFEGQVITLTNERSISAEETFVELFNYNKRGITVGTATPGCALYICGGKKRHFVLPNSKFDIKIPMNPSHRRNREGVHYEPGMGYAPSVEVRLTIEDVLEGRDRVMEVGMDSF